MTRLTILAATTIVLLAAVPALAADLPAKARPLPPAPSWTGLYIGGQVGGGWGDRTVGYTANDPAAALLINGTVFAGNQSVLPHSFGVSGVTGGIEAGYNWQVSPNWLVGVEADFSGSDIKGSGRGTTVLATAAPVLFTQTVSSDQKIEWWGTVRARLGWLATRDLLLFGTAGFAYGKTSTSDSYLFSGSQPGAFDFNINGTGFNCTAINTNCFAGTNSSVQTGWTAGGGAEWRWSSNWTVKAEYLYVNLGRGSIRSSANTLAPLSTALSSYTANFGRTDFHTVRLGLNYHF